jgi:hypothetical protein
VSFLLLAPAAATPGDAPPWWFFAAIVVAVFAAGLFTLRLALARGRSKARACNSCGTRLRSTWVRCPGCGAELGPSGSSAQAAPRHDGPAQLEFKTGPLGGRVFTLERDVTTIGSFDGNTVLLQDTGVSRKHAGIRKVDGHYELADLGSTNGVYVNGEKSARRKLVNGDIVRIGTSEAVFRG